MADYKYFAFISYNHKDKKVAEWLHKKLESYRIPSGMVNPVVEGQKFIRPVFRDLDELNSGFLQEEVLKKLQESKYLIVICSENSIKSSWVAKGIRTFRGIGREEFIIPLMLGEGKECFPAPLIEMAQEDPSKELLGISIPAIGRERAFVKVVSRMLSMDFNTLWDRYKRSERRERVIRTSLAAAFVALLFGIYNLSCSLSASRQQKELLAVRDEISIGNLVPARKKLKELERSRYSKETVAQMTEEIDSYYRYDNFLVPEYTIFRENLWDDKTYEGALDISADGTHVAWSDQDVIHITVPGEKELAVPTGKEIHCVKFATEGRLLYVLHTDGLSIFSTDHLSLEKDFKMKICPKVTRGQSTLSRDYRPSLAIDPLGRYIAVSSLADNGTVVHIIRTGTYQAASIMLADGEDICFVSKNGRTLLYAYERNRSLKGVTVIDPEEAAIVSRFFPPEYRDFLFLDDGTLFQQDKDQTWYCEGKYCMAASPFVMSGSTGIVSKQKGYDALIFVNNTSFCDIGIDPSWIYGYDGNMRSILVLIKEDTILYASMDGSVVIADNGQMFTIFRGLNDRSK